jgi:hypothetical protein
MTVENFAQKLEETDVIYRNGKPFAIVLEIDFYKDLLLYLDDIIDTKKALERFSIYKESGEKEITLDQLKLQMLKEGFSEGELIANNAQ